MRNVEINNPEILDLLNQFKDIFYSDINSFEKNIKPNGLDLNREDWISDEYCKKIMDIGSSHDGYPETLHAYDLKNIHLTRANGDATNRSDYQKLYGEINKKLQTTLNTWNNALAAVYPPGGFIAWHNNANASAYNLIFTWSETGDGYWKHFNPHTSEFEIVKDKPGWQCKAFYFGSYNDKPEELVYHMASTDCWRMTVSYIFSCDPNNRKDMKFMQDMIIEDIESE